MSCAGGCMCLHSARLVSPYKRANLRGYRTWKRLRGKEGTRRLLVSGHVSDGETAGIDAAYNVFWGA
jgi:hypothetical protein